MHTLYRTSVLYVYVYHMAYIETEKLKLHAMCMYIILIGTNYAKIQILSNFY